MPIRRPDHGCHGYSSSQNSAPWAFSSLVVQHDQAPRLNRIQATSTRGVRARIRRAAGCATPTGSAGHAGATANLKLTFHLDHSAGADHSANLRAAGLAFLAASVLVDVRALLALSPGVLLIIWNFRI